MILVTNGLFQGLAGFKCSTVYYSFEWMETVEKEWRRMFNKKARRDATTPACLLYEGGGGAAGGRRHLWAIGCASFYVAFTRALSDAADTSQRAAARSALALSLSRWGAQGDPRLFSWRHLTSALERQLRGRQRYLGETFMFISSLLQGVTWGLLSSLGGFVIRIRIPCIVHVSCMYLACILMCPVHIHQDTSRYIEIHLYLHFGHHRKCILPRDMYPSLRYI